MQELLEAQLHKTNQLIDKKGFPDHNSEYSEQVVLGSVMCGYAAFDEISILSASAFSYDKHRIIYQAMDEMNRLKLPITLTSLGQFCKDQDLLSRVQGLTYLAELHTITPGRTAIDYHVDVIDKRSKATKFISEVMREVASVVNSQADFEVVQDNIIKHCQVSNSKRNVADTLKTPGEIVSEIGFDTFFGVQTPGIMTGIAQLDRDTYGLHPGELIIIGARPSEGKALKTDTPIKTLDGWIPIGSLRVGDELASINGQPSFVTGVYPQGRKQLNKITFSDGRSTLCCDEHLWWVRSRHWRTDYRTLSTSQIAALLTKKRHRGRLSIPVCSGDFGSHSAPLPMRPYLFGYLLGNGCLRHLGGNTGDVTVTIPDTESADRLNNELAFYGCRLNQLDAISYRIIVSSSPPGTANTVNRIFRSLGMDGSYSYDKQIPDVYLTADRQTRLSLLQGLLDSDGWCEQNGAVHFCSSSESLALQVQELARSLGGWSRLHVHKEPKYTHNGEYLTGLPSYRVCVAMPDQGELFLLGRKQARTKKRIRQKRLSITSIEPCGEDEAVCISVSHPSKLYIANDYIVTHNTALLTQLGGHAAIAGHNTHIISLEMSREQLLQRAICQRAGVSFHQVRSGNILESDRFSLQDGTNEMANAPFYIDDSVDWTLVKIKRYLQFHNNKGTPIELLGIDYLQLMPLEKESSRRDLDLGAITRGLKLLAKEFNCVIVLLSQLRRNSENENRKPTKADLRDSGNIEADADIIILIWHDKSKDQPGNPFRTCELLLEKQRNGPVGPVPTYFHRSAALFMNRS